MEELAILLIIEEDSDVLPEGPATAPRRAVRNAAKNSLMGNAIASAGFLEVFFFFFFFFFLRVSSSDSAKCFFLFFWISFSMSLFLKLILCTFPRCKVLEAVFST